MGAARQTVCSVGATWGFCSSTRWIPENYDSSDLVLLHAQNEAKFESCRGFVVVVYFCFESVYVIVCVCV